MNGLPQTGSPVQTQSFNAVPPPAGLDARGGRGRGRGRGASRGRGRGGGQQQQQTKPAAQV